ncbi:MAG TPA: ATP-binding protein [Solirubrobacterales bacterium]
MWRPADIDQFEAAVESGTLEERHDFDAKRQLPSNNKELAKDIAAMSTDGGSLIYGVGEDGNGHPRLLTPIELAGAAERIDQVAQHSVSGSLRLEFVHLRLPDRQDQGYLLVIVPASPEAPHQVTVGDDRRFYGRSDTGNRKLSEEEIARLYERRAGQRVDREELLREYISRSPFGEPTAGETGFLHAFVHPAPPDEELWDRAVSACGEEQILLKELRKATASAASARWGGTELSGAGNWRRRSADTWSLDSAGAQPSDDEEPGRAVRADLGLDGSGYLFYGGAAEVTQRNNGSPVFALFETGIALALAQFLGLAGGLYGAGGFYGPVDVGMAVTGIKGATSVRSLGKRYFQSPPYGEETASRTKRCDARELQERPQEVSQWLLSRLFKASLGRDFNPLSEE